MRRLSVPVILLGLAVALLANPASADSFVVGAFENGNNVGPCTGGGTITSSQPVQTSANCGPVGGSIKASAAASQGHVGASIALSENQGGETFSNAYYDFNVTFTTLNPNASQDPIAVALNLGIDGGFNTDPFAQAKWEAIASQGHGASYVYQASTSGGVNCENNTCQHTMTLTSGSETLTPVSDKINGILTTPLFLNIPLNTPVDFNVLFQVVGNGNVDIDFLNSLDFVKGQDLFTLPTGYTANSTDAFIVNNRFTPPTSAVPEPASLVLLGLGLAGISFTRISQRRISHER